MHSPRWETVVCGARRVDPQPVFREVLGRIEGFGPADKQDVLHLTSGWGVGVRTFDWDNCGAKDQGEGDGWESCSSRG